MNQTHKIHAPFSLPGLCLHKKAANRPGASLPLEMMDFFLRQKERDKELRQKEQDTKESLHKWSGHAGCLSPGQQQPLKKPSFFLHPAAGGVPPYTTISEMDLFFRQQQLLSKEAKRSKQETLLALHSYRGSAPNSPAAAPTKASSTTPTTSSHHRNQYEFNFEAFQAMRVSLEILRREALGCPLPFDDDDGGGGSSDSPIRPLQLRSAPSLAQLLMDTTIIGSPLCFDADEKATVKCAFVTPTAATTTSLYDEAPNLKCADAHVSVSKAVVLSTDSPSPFRFLSRSVDTPLPWAARVKMDPFLPTAPESLSSLVALHIPCRTSNSGVDPATGSSFLSMNNNPDNATGTTTSVTVESRAVEPCTLVTPSDLPLEDAASFEFAADDYGTTGVPTEDTFAAAADEVFDGILDAWGTETPAEASATLVSTAEEKGNGTSWDECLNVDDTASLGTCAISDYETVVDKIVGDPVDLCGEEDSESSTGIPRRQVDVNASGEYVEDTSVVLETAGATGDEHGIFQVLPAIASVKAPSGCVEANAATYDSESTETMEHQMDSSESGRCSLSTYEVPVIGGTEEEHILPVPAIESSESPSQECMLPKALSFDERSTKFADETDIGPLVTKFLETPAQDSCTSDAEVSATKCLALIDLYEQQGAVHILTLANEPARAKTSAIESSASDERFMNAAFELALVNDDVSGKREYFPRTLPESTIRPVAEECSSPVQLPRRSSQAKQAQRTGLKSPSRLEAAVVCAHQWVPNLHGGIAGCERCLYHCSEEEKTCYNERGGYHYRVHSTRGGCSPLCTVAPAGPSGQPTRLCRKCFHDMHRDGLKTSR
jgi:hypothetical protein